MSCVAQREHIVRYATGTLSPGHAAMYFEKSHDKIAPLSEKHMRIM